MKRGDVRWDRGDVVFDLGDKVLVLVPKTGTLSVHYKDGGRERNWATTDIALIAAELRRLRVEMDDPA